MRTKFEQGRSHAVNPFRRQVVLFAGFALVTFVALGAGNVLVMLGDAKSGHEVPKSLWGIFFEDINWAADGGINPEMLANGGFDWTPHDHALWSCREDGWEPDFRDGGAARISIKMGAPVHPNTARHLRIESFGSGLAGVRNRGLDGMWIVDGEKYRLVFDWREVVRDGIEWKLGEWSRFDRTVALTGKGAEFSVPVASIRIEPDKEERMTLSLLVKGRRAVEFDNVSLQPVGPNLVRAGFRKDLVDRIAALKPAFMRFPGGCIAEGRDFQTWYDWRRTVGPKEGRECIPNHWGGKNNPYWQTFNIGFYEYFILCEEIGAEPMPIFQCGLTCQFSKPVQMCAVADVDYFADMILELVEFANGAPNTKWGRVRAAMGHPAPFNLKMVGVGNENWDAEFFDRYEPIVKILRKRVPEIKIIGSAGPSSDGERFDYAWKRVTKETADYMDEHYYRSPKFFRESVCRYDGYDRTGKPKVYVGEYACHHAVGNDPDWKKRPKKNTHWSAVCEAAAMTGFERNSDVVAMASYAPLFAREGHTQWSVQMIWFDGRKSWVTPNYYVQQMFSTNRPDVELPVAVSGSKKVFACAGTCAGETIVKIVNTDETPRTVVLNLKGTAKVTTLAGGMEDINGSEREMVRPVSSERTLDGPLDVPALSVTVLRVTTPAPQKNG